MNHDGSVDGRARPDRPGRRRRCRRGQVPDLRAGRAGVERPRRRRPTRPLGPVRRTQRELLGAVRAPGRGLARATRTTPSSAGSTSCRRPSTSPASTWSAGLGVHALKLGSGELTNQPLLEEVGRRGLPVLCSTGMGTMAEVGDALGWLGSSGEDCPRLLLLHCVSSYPAPIEPGEPARDGEHARAVRGPDRLVRPHRRRGVRDRRRRARALSCWRSTSRWTRPAAALTMRPARTPPDVRRLRRAGARRPGRTRRRRQEADAPPRRRTCTSYAAAGTLPATSRAGATLLESDLRRAAPGGRGPDSRGHRGPDPGR